MNAPSPLGTSFQAIVAVMLAIVCTGITGATTHPRVGPAPAPDRANANAIDPSTLGSYAPPIVENGGRFDPRVAFTLQGSDSAVFFTSDAIVVSLIEGGTGLQHHPGTYLPAARQHTVRMAFAGAARRSAPAGENPVPTRASFFQGSRDRWHSHPRTFTAVRYTDVWPGIDLVCKTSGGALKYDFILDPGADPNLIRLVYEGTTGMRVDETGRLAVMTPAGGFIDEAPIAFQERNGRRIPVAVRFAASAPAESGARTVSFDLGSYDGSLPLVIDPEMTVYCGLIGGEFHDGAGSIAVDAAGNVYVVGVTGSTPDEGFPAVAGPDVTFNPGRIPHQRGDGYIDVFVAKVRADGSGLEYCGYIGGELNQFGLGIAVDTSGNAYVTGVTRSNDATFPVAVGPDVTYNEGGFYGDAFIAKINPQGSALVYCGYIGGIGNDIGIDVAVDSTGAAYVVGETTSGGNLPVPFPVSVGPDLTSGGDRDAFIAKVRPDGTGLVYAGYIGGAGIDMASSVAIDAAGAAYITGVTSSDPASLGAVTGPSLTYSGSVDAFAAKVLPDGSGFSYLGYLGGSGSENGNAIAAGANGTAYIAGSTNSSEATFPVTGGPDLTYGGTDGGYFGDGFIAKIRSNGTGFEYCGYIGGAGGDAINGLAVDSAGRAYVVGTTTSTETTFPLTGGFQDTAYGGGFAYGDAFVAIVASNGARLEAAGYFGGEDEDLGIGIELDTQGSIYIAGATLSTESSFPVTAGPGPVSRGRLEAFVAKLIRRGGPVVSTAVKQGKKLVVTGDGFDAGAQVLVNGAPYKTKRDNADPTHKLKSGKAGKAVKVGDKIRVRNGDGSESNEITFAG